MRATSLVPIDRFDLDAVRTRLRDTTTRLARADRTQLVDACSPRRLWLRLDPPRQLRRLRTQSREFARTWARGDDRRSAPRRIETRRVASTHGGISSGDTVSMVRSSLVLSWAAVNARVGRPMSQGRLR